MFPIKIEQAQHSKIDTIDFNDIKFGRTFSDHMLVAEYYDGACVPSSLW